MAKELEGKVAVVTGASSGIGLASLEAMIAAGAQLVAVARDTKALDALHEKHGDAVIPLAMDLLDPKERASLVPKVLAETGRIDIFHANAGAYVDGNVINNDPETIDRVIDLNYKTVIHNVRDVLPHMIERKTGDIVVTSSLAGHYPTPWEPVYASSKLAINRFVEITRRQHRDDGVRLMEISPGPVETSMVASWEPERLKKAKEDGILIPAKEIGEAVMFVVTRPRGMTVRDMVIIPSGFDL
ncbi:MAG: SDR family oxidoreductase [Alphaproteobacteria bacterium]